MVGVDGNGRGSIEWGVYGVPETFIVGREGTIVYKLVGPVTPANFDRVLKAEIEKALKMNSHSKELRAFSCRSFHGHCAAMNTHQL